MFQTSVSLSKVEFKLKIVGIIKISFSILLLDLFDLGEKWLFILAKQTFLSIYPYAYLA